jgi:hypothetical protein
MSAKAAVSIACMAALPALAGAAQWKADPQFSLAADTDTNRRLLLEPWQSDSAVLAGALAIARNTEITNFVLTPRATVSRYSGEDALDSEDWGISATFRRNGERLTLDLSAAIADDSTLVTELGETGFVQGNTRRRSHQSSASLTQVLTARHLLQYQLAVSDVDYQRTQGTGLVGYRYPSAGLLYVATLSPRLDMTAALSAARLDAPESRLTSDTQSAMVGFRFEISERFDLEASTGRSRTDAHDRSDIKQSFRGSLSWHDELSRLEVSLARSVEPSGRGILVDADDLRLAYSRQLSERVKLDTSARASIREDLGFNLRSNDYRYATGTLALSFRVDENWTLGVAGSYASQKYQQAIDSADGSRIGVSLSWRPLP